MSLSRLEAFSDGIFGIAATLLVLDFKLPDIHHLTFLQQLHVFLTLWRPLLAYLTSFFIIGVIWINHHPIFKDLESVDRWSVLLNLGLLTAVAFLPFPTQIIAEYGAESRLAVAFYGLVQTILGIAFVALWLYVELRYRLPADTGVPARAIALSRVWAVAYPGACAIATAAAFVAPSVSIAVYVIVPMAYLLPNAIEYQLTRVHRSST